MQTRLDVRADSSALREVDSFVLAFVKEHGIAADEGTRILILLEELLTNLIKYGYPDRSERGRAEIVFNLDGNLLTIEFIDDGCAFDPFSQPIPKLDQPPETRPVGGLGLLILRSLADETHYERRNHRNAIRVSRTVQWANLA
jgi:anti-sigma regulatory factor (Ser/Thr protein kinase)